MNRSSAILKEKTLPAIIDINELAEYLGISPVTAVKKAEKGKIPGFKIGRLWRFRTSSIEKWIIEQEELEYFRKISFTEQVDFVGVKIRKGFEKAGYNRKNIPDLIAGVRSEKRRGRKID